MSDPGPGDDKGGTEASGSHPDDPEVPTEDHPDWPEQDDRNR